MTYDIRFLTFDEVMEIHAYQVSQFGGDASVLNAGLLESALAQPMQAFGGAFLHADLFEMAAAYLFHIACNHPFADGNKRTATHCAIMFLAVNGVELDLPTDEAEQLVLRVASGTCEKPEIADFLRRHAV